MLTQTRDDLDTVLVQVGLDEHPHMLGMHLTEIEEEADNTLDLLTALRSYARTGDAVAGQETLAELTVALEHLIHHAQEALPALLRQLDLAVNEEDEPEAMAVA